MIYLSRILIRMRGTLEVITGPMFAGKTQALLSKVRSASSQGLRVGLFKPLTDTRVVTAEVRTHAGDRMPATWTPTDGSAIDPTLDVVAVDEIQFFDEQVIGLLVELSKTGKQVIAAGLDLTSKGEPFGPMPELMAVADKVEKLTAQCTKCGEPGTRSYRCVASADTILIGGSDLYEPRCLDCFSEE